MKSAYELAMDRLKTASPDENTPLTDAQKEELADLDNKYTAKIAEKKIAAKQRISEASIKRDYKAITLAEKELAIDIGRIESDRESAKDRVRQGKQHGV
ncbi:MAG: hypothetical protein O3C43_13640 [Verrucomicrobia bacterium]|nr:hypothetical protein [Verrucomicrobiota bacterium]MDA1067535.1 hypothetical protein [Verrucomicrobiota bacterium]